MRWRIADAETNAGMAKEMGEWKQSACVCLSKTLRGSEWYDGPSRTKALEERDGGRRQLVLRTLPSLRLNGRSRTMPLAAISRCGRSGSRGHSPSSGGCAGGSTWSVGL
jgi:hypothetical protein